MRHTLKVWLAQTVQTQLGHRYVLLSLASDSIVAGTHRLETQTPADHRPTSICAKENDFLFCMAAMSSFWRALRSS
jgi:hypothetical protein